MSCILHVLHWWGIMGGIVTLWKRAHAWSSFMFPTTPSDDLAYHTIQRRCSLVQASCHIFDTSVHLSVSDGSSWSGMTACRCQICDLPIIFAFHLSSFASKSELRCFLEIHQDLVKTSCGACSGRQLLHVLTWDKSLLEFVHFTVRTVLPHLI